MAVIIDSTDNSFRCCDYKCHRAREARCACICDGRYHGCALATNIMPRDRREAQRLLDGELLEGHQYALGFLHQYELELTQEEHDGPLSSSD